MKERTGWVTLGIVLTAFSLLTFFVSPENMRLIQLSPLPLALNMLLASGVVMTSISCVGLFVDRLK